MIKANFNQKVMTDMNKNDRFDSLIGTGGRMKRSLLSHLFISLSVGLLTIGVAGAATLTPITSCTDCHGTNSLTNQAPIEGAQRNSPTRAIVGALATHNSSLTCSG